MLVHAVAHREILIGAWIALASSVFAAELPEASLEPSPTAAEHELLHDQAVAAHDAGNFDQAIELYGRILTENPDDVASIYELSFSEFAAGRFEECAQTARRGAHYRSQLLTPLHMTLASCLDRGGATQAALGVYGEAIYQNPNNFLLRYNYAVSLQRLGRVEEAMRQTKIALTLQPNHPGSNILLSRLYRAQGKRAPAILAGLRYLVLEPESDRARVFLAEIHGMFLNSPNAVVDGKLVVATPPAYGLSEGDFDYTEKTIALMKAAQDQTDRQEPGKLAPMTRARLYVDSLVRMAIQSNPEPRPEQFAARYYLPYFKAVAETGQMEAFVAVAYSTSNSDDIGQWRAAHAKEVADFQRWNEQYSGWQGATITNE